METKKFGKVVISDYMQSRRYNKKLYTRLVEKIEKILQDQQCDTEITISMSAKYQTPYVCIENITRAYSLEAEIEEALDEVGFTPTESEEKYGRYYINFSDEG